MVNNQQEPTMRVKIYYVEEQVKAALW